MSLLFLFGGAGAPAAVAPSAYAAPQKVVRRTVASRRRVDPPTHLVYPTSHRVGAPPAENFAIRVERGHRVKVQTLAPVYPETTPPVLSTSQASQPDVAGQIRRYHGRRLETQPPHSVFPATPAGAQPDVAATIPPPVKRRRGARPGTTELVLITANPVQALPAWVGVSTNRRCGERHFLTVPDPAVAASSPTGVVLSTSRAVEEQFGTRVVRSRRLITVAPVLGVGPAPAVVDTGWLPRVEARKRRDTTNRPDFDVIDLITANPVQPGPAYAAVRAMKHSFERRLQALPQLNTYPASPPTEHRALGDAFSIRSARGRRRQTLAFTPVFPETPPPTEQGYPAWAAVAAHRRTAPRWIVDVLHAPVFPETPVVPVEPGGGGGKRKAKGRDGDRKLRAQEAYLARRRRRDEEEVLVLLATMLDAH